MTTLKANTDVMRASAGQIDQIAAEVGQAGSSVGNLGLSVDRGRYNGQLASKVNEIISGAAAQAAGLQLRLSASSGQLNRKAGEIDAVMYGGSSTLSLADLEPLLSAPFRILAEKLRSLSLPEALALLLLAGFSAPWAAGLLAFVVFSPHTAGSTPKTPFVPNHTGAVIDQKSPSQASRDWWANAKNRMNQYDKDVLEAGRTAGSYGKYDDKTGKTTTVYPAQYNGCGPTVLAMLINFKNNQAQKAPSDYSAAEVFRKAIEDKSFRVGDALLSHSEAEKLVDHYGYSLISIGGDTASVDSLAKTVNSGEPVMALVSSLSPSGIVTPMGSEGRIIAHFVIVTEVSPDGTVHIVNPIDGVQQTVSKTDFAAAWQTTPGNSAKNSAWKLEPI